VATGPGDQTAVAPDGYGHMQASLTDREQAIDTLKAAFAQGRLTKDELDERVARALVPLTYAELASLTDDLPPGLTPVAPLRQGSLASSGVYLTVMAALLLIAAISNGSWTPLTVLGAALFLSPVWLLALVGLLALHSRFDRRVPGLSPPTGTSGTRAPRRRRAARLR
jgi:DUF1707 SHOCT-like domain